MATKYKFKYTTGPFTLPQNAQSIDWDVQNNDPKPQKIRVTVFKINILDLKTVEKPGPLEFVVDPGFSINNANKADAGLIYEIQIECNSQLIFPYACAWPGQIADPIPGTVIKSAEFIQKLS
jgi:hypothetical protein